MPPLPARDLRSNFATWAVPPAAAPAVAGVLLDTLPREAFDPIGTLRRDFVTYFNRPGLESMALPDWA
jgi:hypothetical protein